MSNNVEIKDTGVQAIIARLLSGKDADRALNLAINRTGEAIQRQHRDNINRRFSIRTTNARRFIERLVKWKRSTTRTLTGTLLIEGPKDARARAKILTRHQDGDQFSGTAFIGARDLRQAGRPIPRALYPTALGFSSFRGIDGMPVLARGRGTLGGRTGADTAARDRSKGKRRTFLLRTQDGDTLLMQRTSKTSLRVLWRIERSGTRVKAALRFNEDALRIGRDLLPREAERAIADVIRFGLVGG